MEVRHSRIFDNELDVLSILMEKQPLQSREKIFLDYHKL